MKKTSVLHNEYIQCEHKNVQIHDSYQILAVCTDCGLHDWGNWDNGEPLLEDFKKKYPKAKVFNLDGNEE